ncbi:MAG: hypothetical protein K1X75_15355 [Leptospirales bacterium]|nr:hypothetical protein [Leptospirales bacterium]
MYTIRLSSKHPSGRDLYRLKWEAPDEILQSYRQAGQFLQLKSGEREGYFALASAPGESWLELLIKDQNGLAAAICSAARGFELSCSIAQGKGFAAPPESCAEIHMLAMGTGAAPLRALFKQLPAGRRSVVHFWQASFSAAHLPYSEEHEQWRSEGLTLHLSLDQSSSLPQGVDAFAGDLFSHMRNSRLRLDNACLYWAGSNQFGAAALSCALELGLPPQLCFSNL